MKHGKNSKIKRMAHEFMVWRAGMSVKWICSAAEISEETGITSGAVRKICKRKGWKFLADGRSHLQDSRRPTDELMRSNYTGRN
jgi:hypothetical protein